MGVKVMSGICQRITLCKPADVEVGKAIRVEKSGLVLAVFNLDGEFHVTNDACTHGPGSLSEGDITGDVVECDFHNGSFNIRTGEVVQPPCMIPLKTYRTMVDVDGFVSIEF
jgi:biphenyl 2,3-dioxygenase ferredoxin subunit